MPLPLLAIGVGAGLAALGVGKGIKAGVDTKRAGNVNSQANNTVTEARNALEYARKASGKGLEDLGAKKVFIINRSMNRFVESFGKLKNVELEESAGLKELSRFRLDKQSFDEMKQLGGYVSSLLGGVAGGALGGALTAFGAYSAATMFAAASTGTAIATLSGAAATNATLAFFGGGALAVGGLGMAGGMAVLGGLVAGPALAILGFVVGAKASVNLNKAYSNLAEAQKFAEELQVAVTACNAIRRRSYLFERLLIRLDGLFAPLIFQMEDIVKEKGENYATFDMQEKRTIAAVASTAVAIKTVLDTPVLSEDGKLTEESEMIAKEIQEDVFKDKEANL
jgi:hypothetical protein